MARSTVLSSKQDFSEVLERVQRPKKQAVDSQGAVQVKSAGLEHF